MTFESEKNPASTFSTTPSFNAASEFVMNLVLTRPIQRPVLRLRDTSATIVINTAKKMVKQTRVMSSAGLRRK